MHKNLRNPPETIPKEFKFLKRGDKSADFVINGNSGKIKSLNQVTNSKSEHYIYVISRKNIKVIKNKFKGLVYKNYSSVNGGNYWINQSDIISAWNKYAKLLTRKECLVHES